MNNIEELTNAKEKLKALNKTIKNLESNIETMVNESEETSVNEVCVMALIKSRNELNERAVSLSNEIYKKEIIDKITKHKNKGFVSTKK